MKIYVRNQNGSAIVCAMTTILIISIIGANVLMNCTTRYNVTSKQVSAWRDALAAAEAGADIAFAETRKTFTNPANQFTATGWSSTDATVGPWTYTMPSSDRRTRQPFRHGHGRYFADSGWLPRLSHSYCGYGPGIWIASHGNG